MKYRYLFFTLIYFSLSVSAKNTCVLCNLPRYATKPLFIEGGDSLLIKQTEREIANSIDNPDVYEDLLYNIERQELLLFRQYLSKEILLSTISRKEGVAFGVFEISNTGKISSINMNCEPIISKKDYLFIEKAIEKACFSHAHENWRPLTYHFPFYLDLSALFRTGIESYELDTEIDYVIKYEIEGILRKILSTVEVRKIDHIVYNAFRENPKACVDAFLAYSQEEELPLWLKAIFVSYLPEKLMMERLARLQQLADSAPDIEKLLFTRELEIIELQRGCQRPQIMDLNRGVAQIEYDLLGHPKRKWLCIITCRRIES